MTDQTPTSGEITAPANDAPLSIADAANALAARRAAEAPQPEAPVREPVEPAAPEISSNEEDSAPAEEPISADDDQGQVDPAPEEPSIEAPRSWTKEEKEAFKLLPPEHQQRIAERERKREADIRQGQNEAAEIRKAAEAERQRMEQARQQYEEALPQVLQQLNAQYQSEFADIRNMDDVRRLAKEDPLRFSDWQGFQMQRSEMLKQHHQAQARRQQEEAEGFKSWAAEQDKRASERIPELADPVKAEKVQKEAVGYLTETLGWDEGKIRNLWTGADKISARDADFQMILRDAARWQAAQKAAKTAAAKPVPPVQRPGTAVSKGDAQQADIQNLTRRLERATSTQEQIRLATELRNLKRGR